MWTLVIPISGSGSDNRGNMCVCVCVFSPNEGKIKLPLKVSASLAQVLETLDLSKKAEKENQGESVSICGNTFFLCS